MAPFTRALGMLRSGRELGPIGIELGLHELHMVQLARVGESLEVTAHASVAHGANITELAECQASLSRLIKQTLRSHKFVGRRATAAMPSFYTQVMPVSYQASGGQGDGAAIAKLMQDRVGDISEFVIDYMPVRTLYEGREKLALVAISRHDTVVTFLEILRKAGLDVGALEIGPLAIRRYMSLLAGTGVCNTLVVNCGREKSYLTLLSDDRLLADDEVEFGENGIVESICSALEVTPEVAMKLVKEVNLDPERPTLDKDKAKNADVLTEIVKPHLAVLSQEIQRGLMFAQSESRGTRANKVFLLGSIARWPGTAELLGSMTQCAVATVPSPVQLFQSGSQDPEPAPELAVATGLALREFTEHV